MNTEMQGGCLAGSISAKTVLSGLPSSCMNKSVATSGVQYWQFTTLSSQQALYENIITELSKTSCLGPPSSSACCGNTCDIKTTKTETCATALTHAQCQAAVTSMGGTLYDITYSTYPAGCFMHTSTSSAGPRLMFHFNHGGVSGTPYYDALRICGSGGSTPSSAWGGLLCMQHKHACDALTERTERAHRMHENTQGGGCCCKTIRA